MSAYEQLVAEETLIFDATEEVSRVVAEWPGGITRQELAGAAGLSKAHVVRYLQGKGNPTLRTLARLAHGLDHRVVISLEPTSTEVEGCSEPPISHMFPRCDEHEAQAWREAGERYDAAKFEREVAVQAEALRRTLPDALAAQPTGGEGR